MRRKRRKIGRCQRQGEREKERKKDRNKEREICVEAVVCSQSESTALPQDEHHQQDVDDAEEDREQRRSRVHVKPQADDVHTEADLTDK